MHKKTQFKEQMEDEVYAESTQRGHLNIKVDTVRVTDDIYALNYHSYSIVSGQANGMIELESFVVDLTETKIIALEDVIVTDQANLEGLQSLMSDQLAQDFSESGDSYFEEMSKGAITNWSEWTWSITEKKFAVLFDQYEVAPGSAGPIQIEVPFDKLEPYLQETFAERLSVESEADGLSNQQEKENEPTEEIDPETEGEDDSTSEASSSSDKYVALTFDDGPHPSVTSKVLNHLDNFDAKATFFVLGSQAAYYPDLVRHTAAAGHEISNHTMNHIDLSNSSPEQIRSEITQAEEIIKEATDQPIRLFRPPYGARNDSVDQIIAEEGYTSVLWSVDSLDWKSRDSQAIYDKVMSNTESGSIILLHDIHEATAEALPMILESLTEQGYEMITVSEFMRKKGVSGPGTIRNIN
ncbi:polysaccharide deacetylase family protein [Salisediminibacterium selenitireducens]|nr:polysaccharide deacetylase family protein [Salisediminibacterium selenitireducens]